MHICCVLPQALAPLCGLPGRSVGLARGRGREAHGTAAGGGAALRAQRCVTGGNGKFGAEDGEG